MSASGVTSWLFKGQVKQQVKLVREGKKKKKNNNNK